MSVQFGRWNIDGEPVNRSYLEKVKALLVPYGPDDFTSYSKTEISILHCAFHTTKESRSETQPHVTASGAVITWDGRLDNISELCRRLGDVAPAESADVSIVAAAYERWGSNCFAMLVGDWALSIWEPRTRSLTLAKDPIGVRPLYYSIEGNQINWSTTLDPVVLFPAKQFALCEEYIAGWLSYFPATHLTPYAGIQSVSPSYFVLIRDGSARARKYWEFDANKRVRLQTDSEYEEHFRIAFRESLRRRLRSDSPILAELSGGMDSTSIVCMADLMIKEGLANPPRLDTVSYYDDTEPSWNEKPYFTKIEQKRGRTGCHIDVSSQGDGFSFENRKFALNPGSATLFPERAKHLSCCVLTNGNRVLFSGTGGDEVMGGVPTPVPELEDLLAAAQFRTLAHQLKIWALHKRQPWHRLLVESIGGFLPSAVVPVPKVKRPADWLHADFVRRHRSALSGYNQRLNLGSRPSFQENLLALEGLRRQIGCSRTYSDPPLDRCYPYLDRDLLEFLYAIPRDQLVRPGQRRSLMRRALVGIVPDEILKRSRKAFIARSPMAGIAVEWMNLTALCREMTTSSLGIVDPGRFFQALTRAREGQEVQMLALVRTLAVEHWLRDAVNLGIFAKLSAETSAMFGRAGGTLIRESERSFVTLRPECKQESRKNLLSWERQTTKGGD